jgi:hypothetical protein
MKDLSEKYKIETLSYLAADWHSNNLKELGHEINIF